MSRVTDRIAAEIAGSGYNARHLAAALVARRFDADHSAALRPPKRIQAVRAERADFLYPIRCLCARLGG